MTERSILLSIVTLISGCSGNRIQSAWDPLSFAALEIKEISWFLIAICIFVFLAVLILLFLALYKDQRTSSSPGKKFVLWTGLLIPSAILLVMLIRSLDTTIEIRKFNKEATKDNPLLIKVTGHMWWWEVEYPEFNINTANEIHLPLNRPVRIELTSKDVIHSFWAPNIHGKMDMLPELKTFLNVKASKAGTFRGQCAEYCGLQHSHMALYYVVMPGMKFDEWVASKQKTIGPLSKRGQEVYFEQSCHTCHAIKNTSAQGKTGPDLTHIASRLSLGAGTVPNTRENLRQWIINSHVFKPKNRMPAYRIKDEDLKALIQYLEELK